MRSEPKGARSAGQAVTIDLLRTTDLLRRRLSELIEPHGVTLQQYNVLRILRGVHPDPLPTLDIADRMIEHAPAITGLLDRLEGKGLVRRQRCTDDRRRVHCWITDAGLTLLAGLDAPVDTADAVVAEQLADADVAHLLRTLEAVRRSLS